jgi:hypothetical protein
MAGYMHGLEENVVMPAVIAVFLYGIIACFISRWRIDRATSDNLESVLVRSEHLDQVTKALFIIAVIGTAVGIRIAFGSIGSDSMATPEGARAASANLLSGAGIAYGSSLAGLTAALWTLINVQIVKTAAALASLRLGISNA